MAVVLEPARAVHTAVPDMLNRIIVGSAITIIEFTERKKAFEVIAGAVEAEGGKESGGSAVAINKRVDVDELKLCQSGDEYRMDVSFQIQPFDKLSHEIGNVCCGWGSVNDLTGFSVGDELEGTAVVEQFKPIVPGDSVNLFTCEQFFGLFEGELSTFDVCGSADRSAFFVPGV